MKLFCGKVTFNNKIIILSDAFSYKPNNRHQLHNTNVSSNGINRGDIQGREKKWSGYKHAEGAYQRVPDLGVPPGQPSYTAA